VLQTHAISILLPPATLHAPTFPLMPDAEPPSPATLSAADGPLLLRDLPLWRVQWAALPGSREALHVHVPHYTSMFERLWREPGPWRFGHIMLPEGSKNLGNPEFALTPDTKVSEHCWWLGCSGRRLVAGCPNTKQLLQFK
jgi:hypothetical protein